MMSVVRSWAKENQSLIFFLIVQFVAVMGAVFSITVYITTLETRVAILEVRGSPHLAEINNRLTTTEKETQANKERLDHVIDILTRELGRTIK